MNIGVHASFQIRVFTFFSGVELLGHMETLILVFREVPYCFPPLMNVNASIYIPTDSVGGFSTPSLVFRICRFLELGFFGDKL